MDPLTALGAAGSAIGIASFGIELFKILRTFVSQVISAQEQLEEVIAEIKSTASALEEIYFYLEKEVHNVEAGKPLELFTESSLIKVKDTADKCLVVFWRIEIAMSGNEPDGFDDELRNRLNSFNQKLASYCTGQIIEIELQLNSGPLRFRDKFRWALQSSKLEKFCKGLQGHRNHLVLLLQIVLLGQQQAKQHTTKQDNLEIYTFLKIVTPEELRLMALEAQEDGQRRRGRSRRPASSKIHWPLENPRIQSPTRQDSSNIIQLPELQEPWVHVHPQAKTYFASADTKTRHMRTPSPPDRRLVITHETVNDQTTSFREGERQASDRLSISTAAGEYERTQKAEHTKHVLPNDPSDVVDDLIMSPKTEVDPDLPKATDVAVPKDVVGGRRPDADLPQDRQTDLDHVNGYANPQQQKIANDDARKHSLDRSAQGRIATHNSIDNASVPPARSVITEEGNTMGRGAERSPSAVTSSGHDISEKRALEPPERESAVLKGQRSSTQNTVDGSGKELLPYVIQEEGAYRLSSSLLSELDLKMELAFLSPGQLQTLRELLQYRKEDEPLKLVKIEVAKKPNRRFWKKKRHVIVAFVEGNVSDVPGVLLPQADMTKQQIDGIANLQRTQEVNQGRPPPRIGLPEFQDVTNDLSNTTHTPWSQTSNGDWFTEYRVWHIEPYSAHDTGEESGNDWARSFLKEETLPRVEIKRRLRILDKDPATMIEKSAKLTNAQQFQVWRSIEAAKLGDPDPDYQWRLRQLEIIRARRLFLVKQVKAIIVYVSKAPRLADRNTSDNAPEHDFIDAMHRNDINTNNNITPRRPMNSQDSSGSLSVESGAFPAAILSNRESIGRQVDGKRTEEMASHLKQNIIRANSSIAGRPPIPRRQTRTSTDELDHGLPRNYDKEREEELVRKIRRLELEIKRDKRERELQGESERRESRPMPETQSVIGSGPRNEAGRAEREPLGAQHIQSPRESKIIVGDTEYTSRGYGSRAHLQSRIDGDSQNRATVRFIDRSRSNTPHQPTYDNDLKMEKSRARYPSQFDRRRFDPQSVAESQNAVKQLLLEWTPAHMRDDDKKENKVSVTYDEGGFTSDTESEEYVMAEEQQEQEESSYSRSASKVANDPRKSKVEREGVHVMPSIANHAGGYQDSLNQEKEKVAHGDVVLQDWGTLGNRTGGIFSSPQQLSRPSSQSVNNATGADEKPQRDVPQIRTLSEGSPTRKTNNDIHPFNGAKTIARASTLPQTSRQPWSDEDWARQIVEETAGTVEDETRLDRLRERRASFHSPVSKSIGREVRTSRQRNSSDVPTDPLRILVKEY
ncbi:hypothetical protein EV127DRAFT_168939 [Xylaria flabelliformis]|nr:hypothetical protein EV127DRAFT_168939 [Xylaria flabelliformis]